MNKMVSGEAENSSFLPSISIKTILIFLKFQFITYLLNYLFICISNVLPIPGPPSESSSPYSPPLCLLQSILPPTHLPPSLPTPHPSMPFPGYIKSLQN